MMVSLKSFLHYFSQPKPSVPLSEGEQQQNQRPGFGEQHDHQFGGSAEFGKLHDPSPGVSLNLGHRLHRAPHSASRLRCRPVC